MQRKISEFIDAEAIGERKVFFKVKSAEREELWSDVCSGKKPAEADWYLKDLLFKPDTDCYTPAPVLGLSRFFANEHNIVTAAGKAAGSKAVKKVAEKVPLGQIDLSLADRVDIHGNINNKVDSNDITAKRIIRAVQDVDFINVCIERGIKLSRRETAMALAIKRLPHLAVLVGRPDLEPPAMKKALQSRDQYVNIGRKKQKRRASSSSSSCSSSSLTHTEEGSSDSSEHTSDDYSEVQKEGGADPDQLEQNLARSAFGKNLDVLKKAAQHKQTEKIQQISKRRAGEVRRKKERVMNFMSKADLKTMKQQLTKSVATQLLQENETSGASSSQSRRISTARRSAASRPVTGRSATPARRSSTGRTTTPARRSTTSRASTSRIPTTDLRSTEARSPTPDPRSTAARSPTPTRRTSTPDPHSSSHSRPNLVERAAAELGARPKDRTAAKGKKAKDKKKSQEEDLFASSSE